jgi:hypothetical protein
VNQSRPNLFEFATSELSQDAFLAWLLAWANKQYLETDPNLHGLGVRFLTALLTLEEIDQTDLDLSQVRVRRQDSRVDVVVELGDLVLAIEDKTNTALHPGNEKSFEQIAQKYSGRKVLPIFIKTGDQANYDDVTNRGLRVFPRDRLLAILQEDASLLKRMQFYRISKLSCKNEKPIPKNGSKPLWPSGLRSSVLGLVFIRSSRNTSPI